VIKGDKIILSGDITKEAALDGDEVLEFALEICTTTRRRD